MKTTTAPPTPTDRDRERFLLGCVLFGMQPEQAVCALSDLPAAAFRDPSNRNILLAIQALHNKGVPAGLSEVASELEGTVDPKYLLSLEDAIDSELLFAPRLRMLRQTAGISDEDTMPRIPDSAWVGLFKTWREIIAPCTEASLESLWSAFLVAVGLICGRNIRVENPRPLYPNFYTMNLGVTGDSRKSTGLWFCESGIRRVGEEVEIIRGIVSTEGIYERLSAEKHPGGAKALGPWP